MLNIEFSMPDACLERSKKFEICAEIDDDTIFIKLKSCAHCGKTFNPQRAEHRFCYRGRCRQDFHEARRTHPVRTDPSLR